MFLLQSMLFRYIWDLFNLGQFDPIYQMIPLTVIPLSVFFNLLDPQCFLQQSFHRFPPSKHPSEPGEDRSSTFWPEFWIWFAAESNFPDCRHFPPQCFSKTLPDFAFQFRGLLWAENWWSPLRDFWLLPLWRRPGGWHPGWRLSSSMLISRLWGGGGRWRMGSGKRGATWLRRSLELEPWNK
jgi:hypothetical protein